MGSTVRLVLGGAAATAALVAAAVPPAGAGPVDDTLPGRVVTYDPPVSEATWPGVDYGRSPGPGDDRPVETTWRVVERTGNCCENYVTTTPSGRLLDFGGSYVTYTDDRGLTWRQVRPLTPLVNGEGAIVAAPGGDVLGVEWDPYTGDHLQAYRYEAETGQWTYTEMPVHQPFYDREWIAVVPGPVTWRGERHEWLALLKGGWPTKEVWYASTDGLHYTDVTSKFAEQQLSAARTRGPLAPEAAPENDWVQPNTNSGITPLGDGDALAAPDEGDAWYHLEGTTSEWSAFTHRDGRTPSGVLQTDSAGRLHEVVPGGDGFTYRMSADGGDSWVQTPVELPAGHTIEELDFRAHRAAGVAAVGVHAHDSTDGADQDLLYTVDITGDRPVLARRSQIGAGDVSGGAGVGSTVRFDFETVAVFPDGRVAVSFYDSTTADDSGRVRPALAIEQETRRGGSR